MKRTKYATVKDTEGRVYELRPARLYQPKQHKDLDGMASRWVLRADVRKRMMATLHNEWSKELKDAMFEETYAIRIMLNSYNDHLEVGCREFGPTATKKILEWAGYKPNKSAKTEAGQ